MTIKKGKVLRRKKKPGYNRDTEYCTECGKQLERRIRRKTMYCRKHAPMLRRKRDEFKCEVCGSTKERLMVELEKNTHHYCSNKCAGIGQSKLRTGENGANYRIGNTKEVKRKKDITRWKTMKLIKSGKIKRLTCEECGEMAQAHHTDYNDHINVRWLCRKHHMFLHRKDKTREEALEAAKRARGDV